MTLKLLFTACLLDAQDQEDNVENKPASLLVVPLSKARKGFPHLGVVDRWPPTPKRARGAILSFMETIPTYFQSGRQFFLQSDKH